MERKTIMTKTKKSTNKVITRKKPKSINYASKLIKDMLDGAKNHKCPSKNLVDATDYQYLRIIIRCEGCNQEWSIPLLHTLNTALQYKDYKLLKRFSSVFSKLEHINENPYPDRDTLDRNIAAVNARRQSKE
jgi:hypothetical protein